MWKSLSMILLGVGVLIIGFFFSPLYEMWQQSDADQPAPIKSEVRNAIAKHVPAVNNCVKISEDNLQELTDQARSVKTAFFKEGYSLDKTIAALLYNIQTEPQAKYQFISETKMLLVLQLIFNTGQITGPWLESELRGKVVSDSTYGQVHSTFSARPNFALMQDLKQMAGC